MIIDPEMRDLVERERRALIQNEWLAIYHARPVAQRVFRTGKQSLISHGGRWFVRLVNRTNDTVVEIAADRVPAWEAVLASPTKGA